MKLSLALGGGGSKGSAHIGVLRVLEREGHEVAAVAGTSIGGLIGAVYAFGLSPDEIEKRLAGTEFRQLFRREPGPHNSLLGLAGITELLTEVLGDTTFDELRIPLAVTSLDIISGQEVILKQGRVRDAVLATIALPGIFPTQKWGDYELVDGGLCDPVPVAVARSLAPKLPVVAVVLSKPPQPGRVLAYVNPLAPIPVLERLSRLPVAQAFHIFTRSVFASGRLLTEYRLQVENPALIIRPDVDHIGLLDRVDVRDISRLGEEAAERELPKLAPTGNWIQRLAARVNQR
jgi:NTE family protein